MESFVSGWEEALSIARELDMAIPTDTLRSRVLCNGPGWRKYRFPDAHATRGLSNIGHALQDLIGRASGRTVLKGMLGDSNTTKLLWSRLADGPEEVRDDGYDEANRPGSGNGWACLSDTPPTRHAGLRSATPNGQCDGSVCFCPGMKSCGPKPRWRGGGEETFIPLDYAVPKWSSGVEKRSLNRADLADEWHREHSKGEPDPFFRGPIIRQGR